MMREGAVAVINDGICRERHTEPFTLPFTMELTAFAGIEPWTDGIA